MTDVQTVWLSTPLVGQPGSPSTLNLSRRDSKIVEGADTRIPFGVAVQLGADNEHCRGGMAAGRFWGVSLQDPTLNPEQENHYVEGDILTAVYEGELFVEALGPISTLEDVYARNSDGKLGVLNSRGVNTVRITAPGNNYASAPDVTFDAPTGASAATRRTAKGRAILVNGAVDRIIVDDPGFGYTAAPNVTVAGAATADCALYTMVKINSAKWLRTSDGYNDINEVRLAQSSTGS